MICGMDLYYYTTRQNELARDRSSWRSVQVRNRRNREKGKGATKLKIDLTSNRKRDTIPAFTETRNECDESREQRI